MSIAAALRSVALIGNPNTGKTTLFNALTGLTQQVGNYPGVTVEHVTGMLRGRDRSVQLVDLPGTYSLAARSADELVAVDVLLGQQPGQAPVDCIVAIVDASNLARNLYLASQVLELGLPVVVALTMVDVAERRGTRVNADALAEKLGIPVVPVRADKRQGLAELEQAIVTALEEPSAGRSEGPELPRELLDEAKNLHAFLNDHGGELGRPVQMVEAFRALVDAEGEISQRFVAELGRPYADELTARRTAVGSDKPLAALEAAARYKWVNELARACVRASATRQRTLSDRIDTVLTHRVAGTLVLAAVLALMFQAIYAWSGPAMDLITGGADAIGSMLARTLPEGALRSLAVDGIVGGVGGVLVFLPQILLLFLFVAILEDCGYMARAAFLMDKLLTKVGLSGQSVIPLLSSFACAVPGIMAARSIPNRRDRLATVLVAPLMSCSARLPVYVLLIAAFVPERTWAGGWIGLQGLMLFAAHLIGILVAIPTVWLIRRTFLRGPVPAFVMELPEYRRPVLRNVLTKLWIQGKEFVVRAGTIIFAFTIIVWAMTYFPRSEEVAERFVAARAQATTQAELAAIDSEEAAAYARHSLMGRIGRAIEPAVEPLGWDWRIGMAAAASIPAREVIIATLGTILGVGSDVDETSADLTAKMKRATWPDGRPLFTLPVALSLIVFFALCCQCVSTLVVIRREAGSWGWVAFTFGYMTALAYVGAFATYQLSRMAGL